MEDNSGFDINGFFEQSTNKYYVGYPQDWYPSSRNEEDRDSVVLRLHDYQRDKDLLLERCGMQRVVIILVNQYYFESLLELVRTYSELATRFCSSADELRIIERINKQYNYIQLDEWEQHAVLNIWLHKRYAM
jgi:hypothetical protein